MAPSLVPLVALALLAEGPQSAPSGANAVAPRVAAGFLFKEITFDQQTHAYCVYVPPEYAAEREWPVILFLHGSGERGRDGFLHTDLGLPRSIRRNRARCPAIVVMPQCPPGATWSGDTVRMALACLQQTSREYRLDPQRIYLTGLSLGGAGTWLIGAALPERFAALAPVCGFGDPRDAAKLAGVPIWCFHGSADKNVPVERAREMVSAIRAAGGNIQYTEYDGAGHDVWTRTYDDPAFWRWLLAQRRAPEPKSNP